MPADTLETLIEELAKTRSAITKVYESQAYTSGGPGDGMHHARAQLAQLHDREKWLVGRIDLLESREAGGNTGLVQFERVR